MKIYNKKKVSIIYLSKRHVIHYIDMFILVLLGVLIISCLHVTFNTDEEYTMGLIQHGYKDIMHINSLDVHPNTYYLLLKLFLNITTFWTNSLFIKVIFARFFSLLAFSISFIVLIKIIKLSGISINWKIILMLYLLLTPIVFYATSIRMHEFSSLFNILEYYELILFFKNKKNSNLMLVFIYSLLAIYMDYFSAVCSGVFILIYFAKSLIKKDQSIIFKVLMTGILLLIFSIPDMLMLIDQVLNRKKYMTSSSSYITLHSLMSSLTQSNSLLSIIFMIPIIYSFIKFNKYHMFNEHLLEVLINYLISNIIAICSCIKFNVYESKFMYPQFSIYSFFIIIIIILTLRSANSNNLIKSLFILLLVLLGLKATNTIISNVKSYDVPSLKLMSNIKRINNKKNKSVYLNYKNVPRYFSEGSAPKQVYVTQYSLYLNTLHKRLILEDSNPSKVSKILNGENILLHKTFTNLYFSKLK